MIPVGPKRTLCTSKLSYLTFAVMTHLKNSWLYPVDPSSFEDIL